jgi:hypothetical protein
MSRSLARTAQFLLESLFAAATWLALLLIGLAMAFRRGWTAVDRSERRARYFQISW